MTINEPLFEKTVQETHEWLQEFQRVLQIQNRRQTYAVVRTVLHALRDSLQIGEAANLAAEMPTLMKGIYYEGWRPTGKHIRLRSGEEFINYVQQQLPGDATYDVAKLVAGVFTVLRRRISEGESTHVASNFSSDMRSLWEQEV